jgi:hypothetical protein
MSDGYQFSFDDIDDIISSAAMPGGGTVGDMDFSDYFSGSGQNFDFGSLDPNAFSLDSIDSMINDAALGLGDFDFSSLDLPQDFLSSASVADIRGTDMDALLESMGAQGIEGLEDIDAGDARVLADMGSSNRGYYNEETGEFINDPNGPLSGPLDERSGTNRESMDGYTYDRRTGTWTTPSGQVYRPSVAPTHTTQSGAQVQVNAGSLPSGYAGLTPATGSTASTTSTGGGGGTRTTGGGGGSGTKNQAGLGALLPLLLALLAMNKSGGGGGGSRGATIPGLTATQRQTPYAQQQRAPGYRPGQGGVNYFEQTQFTPRMAAGGGIGGLLNGPGDGVSDSIPAVIDGGMADGGQPAQVARGEYIMDARTVAALGNGSTDAGAERLDKMRENILRDDRQTGVGEDSKAYRHLMA